MALFTQSELRARGTTIAATRSADRILQESAKAFSRVATYDVFLSHSFADAAVVLGLKKLQRPSRNRSCRRVLSDVVCRAGVLGAVSLRRQGQRHRRAAAPLDQFR